MFLIVLSEQKYFANDCCMQAQTELFQVLKIALDRGQQKNPLFSMRALAKRLEVSPSLLSDALAGKRRLTEKTAKKILDRLGVEPEKSRSILSKWEVLSRAKQKVSSKKFTSQSRYLQLATDEFYSVSKWHHFAIYVLAECSDFHADPKWISRRIGIKLQEAKGALERLLRLSFLIQNSSGQVVQGKGALTTTQDLPSGAIQNRFRDGLKIAESALTQVKVLDRDFSNIMVATSPAKMAEAKIKLANFRREFCDFLESCAPDEKTAVYSLDMQFYPLTKVQQIKKVKGK